MQHFPCNQILEIFIILQSAIVFITLYVFASGIHMGMTLLKRLENFQC